MPGGGCVQTVDWAEAEGADRAGAAREKAEGAEEEGGAVAEGLRRG